jgi:hypothetical protein
MLKVVEEATGALDAAEVGATLALGASEGAGF